MRSKKKEYYKLVRDHIPEIIRGNGEYCRIHIAKDKEFGWRLKKKLQEEIDEFKKNPCAEELADILEVLECLRKFNNIDLEEVRDWKVKKKREKGGFDKRIILEYTQKK